MRFRDFAPSLWDPVAVFNTRQPDHLPACARAIPPVVKPALRPPQSLPLTPGRLRALPGARPPPRRSPRKAVEPPRERGEGRPPRSRRRAALPDFPRRERLHDGAAPSGEGVTARGGSSEGAAAAPQRERRRPGTLLR